MGLIERLQDYLGELDPKGKPINVLARLKEASDRTRPFYLKLAKETREFLDSEFPDLDFKRKTGLPARELARRMKMLGIERSAKEVEADG